MRRKDRHLTERADIDRILRAAQVCRVAFAVGDEPYLVPLSFGYDGVALYFHTAREGRKIECIAANPRVCFEVEGASNLVRDEQVACRWSTTYESVIGYGAVRELCTAEAKIEGLNHIMRHYSGTDWEYGGDALKVVRVWRLEVESLSGKRSG